MNLPDELLPQTSFKLVALLQVVSLVLQVPVLGVQENRFRVLQTVLDLYITKVVLLRRHCFPSLRGAEGCFEKMEEGLLCFFLLSFRFGVFPREGMPWVLLALS